jgi:hypothetical protein
MNIFLAGGISGNISASWKKLAHDIEQCAFISQERTERAVFSEKSIRGGEYDTLSRRRASGEERELLGNQGGAKLFHS